VELRRHALERWSRDTEINEQRTQIDDCRARTDNARAFRTAAGGAQVEHRQDSEETSRELLSRDQTSRPYVLMLDIVM
jgi:hypothetical protein